MKRGKTFWMSFVAFFCLDLLVAGIARYTTRVDKEFKALREETFNRDTDLAYFLMGTCLTENGRLKLDLAEIRKLLAASENKPSPADLYSKLPYLAHIFVASHEKPILPMLPPTPQSSMAAGVLIRYDQETYVLTAGHTFEKPEDNLVDWIAVRLNIPGTAPHYAELYAWDPETDLALLRFNDGFVYNGPVVEIADSSDLRTFTPVVALGSPMGMAFSGTLGCVVNTNTLGLHNATHRMGIDRPEALVHSATLAPGNSGGPLLHAETGKLLGINTSIVYVGLYAAVPSEDILLVLPRLAKGGRLKHGFIPGIEVANTLDLPAREFPNGTRPAREGVLITQIRKDMLGGKIFEPWDIAVEVGGMPTPDAVSFWREVMNTEPGTPISIKVIRAGALWDIPVKLEERIMR